MQSTLDQQVKELNSRLDEEVANATKAAKRDQAKLQAKVTPKFCKNTEFVLRTQIVCNIILS